MVSSLRIAIYYAPNAKDIRSDSSSLTFKDVIDGLNKVANKHGVRLFFYVVLPRDVVGYEMFEDIGNVKVLKVARRREMFFDEINIVDPEIYYWFNQRVGIYPIDLFITSKSAVATDIQRLLTDYRYGDISHRKEVRIPVVVFEDWVFGRKNITSGYIDAYEFARRSLTYGMLKTILLSDFEFDEVLDFAKLYVSDALYNQMFKNIVVNYQGIPCDEIDAVTKNVGKREKFTLFWGGRFSANKNVEFILRTYLRMYAMGYDVDIVITTPAESYPKEKKLYDLIEKTGVKLYTSVSREQYLRFAKSSHVMLSASKAEAFSIGHLEVAYVGLPLVLPNRLWARFLFGDDYPWMYRYGRMDEALAYLTWIYDNYDEALGVAQDIRDKIREKYDQKTRYERLLGILLAEYEAATSTDRLFIKPGSETGKTIEVAVEKMRVAGYTEFSWYMLLNEVRKYMDAYNFEDPRVSLPSKWDVYQYVKRVLNIMDKCDKPIPVFVYGEAG